METTAGIFQANVVLVEPTNRFICGSLEPTAGQVHQLAATAGRDGSGCVHAGLGQLEVLCVPAFQTHPQMLVKDLEGSSGCTTADAGLASTTLVANDNGVGIPAASYPETGGESFVGSGREPSSIASSRVVADGRLGLIRQRFEKRGLSGKVVHLLLAGNRETTSTAYQSCWNGWVGWFTEQNHDPVSPALGIILDFLSDLHIKGLPYKSINVYRSMLSGTLEQMEGYDIGKHPLIIKLMQGIFNSSPPKPKYTGFWDVDVVLRHLQAQGPDIDLSLTSLSHKLVVLLALTSLFRVSEIAAIDSESMVFSGPVVKFALLKLRKNQRKSKGIKSFSLKKLNPSSNLCPVLCLERYVSVTQSFRGSASNLILGIKSPHAPIGASSIARWIKSVLAEAGIDISVYSAHSTGGAAASKVKSSGLPIETILRTGSWATESVFSTHYNKSIVTENFQNVVLEVE